VREEFEERGGFEERGDSRREGFEEIEGFEEREGFEEGGRSEERRGRREEGIPFTTFVLTVSCTSGFLSITPPMDGAAGSLMCFSMWCTTFLSTSLWSTGCTSTTLSWRTVSCTSGALKEFMVILMRKKKLLNEVTYCTRVGTCWPA
jgi:hypothetical protein